MKEEISAIIRSMLETDEKEREEVLQSVLSKLKNSTIDMSNPDHFYTMLTFQIWESLSVLARNLHEEPEDKKNTYKLNFLFTNYGFLSSHIEKLITDRCGSSCVADRSRHILSIYQRFLLDGTIPANDRSEEHYWVPKFGTYEQWIAYCDGLYDLYYGNPHQYLTAYSSLLQSDVQTYKHILHHWFLTWKDGKEYQFLQTYDHDDKNPLESEYYSNDEFYLIHKRCLPETEYETNKEYRMPFMLKVPKKDVLQIRSVSETVYQ